MGWMILLNKITTAFVLGAGLGTRLRPLTTTCPKPLLPVQGRPMVTYVFDALIRAGIRRFIVNTHHAADAWTAHFPGGAYQGVPITFRHEPDLLGTAGGLKNIEDLAGGETFLLHSGDVLTNLPLDPLISAHSRGKAEMTLALRVRPDCKTVGLDDGGVIRHIGSPSATSPLHFYDYANVGLVEPAFFRRIPDTSPRDIGSIWSAMAKTTELLRGVVINEGYWFNVGTVAEYAKIQECTL